MVIKTTIDIKPKKWYNRIALKTLNSKIGGIIMEIIKKIKEISYEDSDSISVRLRDGIEEEPKEKTEELLVLFSKLNVNMRENGVKFEDMCVVIDVITSILMYSDIAPWVSSYSIELVKAIISSK